MHWSKHDKTTDENCSLQTTTKNAKRKEKNQNIFESQRSISKAKQKTRSGRESRPGKYVVSTSDEEISHRRKSLPGRPAVQNAIKVLRNMANSKDYHLSEKSRTSTAACSKSNKTTA